MRRSPNSDIFLMSSHRTHERLHNFIIGVLGQFGHKPHDGLILMDIAYIDKRCKSQFKSEDAAGRVNRVDFYFSTSPRREKTN